MKITLVNPSVDLEKTLGKFKKVSQATPPLGIGYLAAVLRDQGCDVSVLDAYAEKLTIEETVQRILQLKTKIVCISCYSPNAYISMAVAEQIKEKSADIIVVAGGAHATLMPEDVLKDQTVDFVVKGEGEEVLPQLVQCLDKGKDYSGIPGLVYRENGDCKHTSLTPARVENLDSLPYPAWDLFPLEIYRPLPHWMLVSPDIPIFPMTTSRGCPYSCSYCSLEISGKKIRLRSIENVIGEIEYLNNNFGAQQIMFWDPTFPVSKKRDIDLLNVMIDKGLGKKVKWMTETRVNYVALSMLELMKKAGCGRIAYGFESGDDQLLKNIRKGFTIEQARKAARATRKVGIEMLGYFLIGLPGENPELSRKTVAFAKELDVDVAKFNLLVPYPGTQIYKDAVASHTLKEKDWSKYSSFAALETYDPIYAPEGYDKRELVDTVKWAYRSFYFRPWMVWKYLKKLRSWAIVKLYFKYLWQLIMSVGK